MVNSFAKYNSDIVHSYDNFFGFPVKFGGIESKLEMDFMSQRDLFLLPLMIWENIYNFI